MDSRLEDTPSGETKQDAVIVPPNDTQTEVLGNPGTSVAVKTSVEAPVGKHTVETQRTEPSVEAPSVEVPVEAPVPEPSSTEPPKKSKGRTIRIVLLVVCLIVAALCGGYLLFNSQNKQSSTDTAASLAKNPKNFSQLQQQNPDIIGWITIPNTMVDYPILQSPTDDFFYLTHNEQGETELSGAIYMEMANSPTFSDPVTVLYGHNVSDDSMFTTLHYFENSSFFQDNDTMTVYSPGHILTYRIIAVYFYDNRHILNSFNLSNPDVRAEYYTSVLNPTSLVSHVREGASLNPDDKILQLSTCLDSWSWSNQRLIVTGALVNDEPTR